LDFLKTIVTGEARKLVKIMSKFLKKSNEKGIIHIQSTRNNTIITLTDLEGNTKFGSSAGNLGFKNSRKSTSYASQAVAELVATKALNLGFDSVIIHLSGLGYGKLTAVRALYKSKLGLIKIIEKTPSAHNGCRPPKKRRV
jgi:small subunit ribosomal protein S11